MPFIRYNPCLRQKHPGVPDCSDSLDQTTDPVTENYTLPIAQAMGRVAYLYLLLCALNVATDTHNQKDLCVIFFTGAAVMFQPFTQCPEIFKPFSGRVPHFTSLLLLYIGCRTHSFMFSFEIVSSITKQFSLQIHCLPLDVLSHYRILHVQNIPSNLHTLQYYALSPTHSASINHGLAMLLPAHLLRHCRHRHPHTRRYHEFRGQFSGVQSWPIVAGWW